MTMTKKAGIFLVLLLFSFCSFLYSAVPGRITANGTQFSVCGNRIWMNGANTPWDNWNDFGGTYDSAFWNQHFADLHAAGVNASRIWITCSGEVGINIDTAGNVTGATAAHWSNLDDLFAKANANGIYIMATFISFDHFKNTYTTYQRWRNWIANDANIDSYINNYITPFLTRYGNNPALWSIDLCNEPEWASSTENTGEPAVYGAISWTRFQTYFAKASVAIHKWNAANGSGPMVTVGMGYIKYNTDTRSLGGENKLADADLAALIAAAADKPLAKMDFWSTHYYPWQNAYGGIIFTYTPSAFGLPNDRPSVVGECPNKYGSTNGLGTQISGQLRTDYTNGYNNGWQGFFPWTSNGAGSGDFGNLDTELRPAAQQMQTLIPTWVFPPACSAATNTPTNTVTNTFTNTRTNTPTHTNTFTQTYTNTPVPPTSTFTHTRTYTFTATFTNTAVPPTNTYTSTDTAVPPTFTFTATATNTQTGTATHTNTNTQVPPTATFTLTFTHTSTDTQIPSTATYTNTNTAVPPTFTDTATNTPDIPTFTYTSTQIPATSTFTDTQIPSTLTHTYTNTFTQTATLLLPSATYTRTPTATATATMTVAATNTYTYTVTAPAATFTNTRTFTFTPTATHTFTLSFTYTATQIPASATFTFTLTPTETFSYTPTGTETPYVHSEEKELKIRDQFIYPNPVLHDKAGKMYVSYTATKSFLSADLVIYSASYRKIKEITISGPGASGKITAAIAKKNLSVLANGTYYYLIKLKGNNGEMAKSKAGMFIIIK